MYSNNTIIYSYQANKIKQFKGVYKMFNCSCCGSDVSSPYFFEGGVYGYTCIKKVNPKVKRNKGKCHLVEVVKVVFNDENSSRGKAYVIVNNDKIVVTAYREMNEDMTGFIDKIEIGNFQNFNNNWYAFL